MNRIQMELVPFVSVGPFVFNSLISDYKDFSFIELKDEYDEIVKWIPYRLSDSDDRIYVNEDTNRIESVTCHEECFYQGKNLIGLEEGVLKSLIPFEVSETDTLELDWGNETTLKYDDLGIMVFIVSGFVDAITCSDI